MRDNESDAKLIFPTLAERIVCINLLERDDRMKQAQKQFAQVGLEGTVKFHRVQRHSRGGRYGCYDSHRQVMHHALNDGVKSLLIFEDDVQFKEGWEKVVLDTKEFVDSGNHFDAFFLGMQLLFMDEEFTPNIWRIKCTNAHAYIVTRNGMEAFIASSELFEEELRYCPHDIAQNSVWQHIYGHLQTEGIKQDPDLGSDNLWYNDIPQEYAAWFQIRVLNGTFDRWVVPLVSQKWYRTSWFGRQFVFGLDHRVIDDGRVHLKGAPMVDVILAIVCMLFTYPPFGYVAFVRDMGPVILSQFGKAPEKN